MWLLLLPFRAKFRNARLPLGKCHASFSLQSPFLRVDITILRREGWKELTCAEPPRLPHRTPWDRSNPGERSLEQIFFRNFYCRSMPPSLSWYISKGWKELLRIVVILYKCLRLWELDAKSRTSGTQDSCLYSCKHAYSTYEYLRG